MTTIAYRDGILMGDTRAYGFDRGPVGVKPKVYRLDDGSLFGCSSVGIGVPNAILEWLREGRGESEPDLEGFTVESLLVRPDGSAEIFDHKLRPSVVRHPFYVIGSGREYAYAALHLGLSAAEAITVACDLDPWSEFPLYGLTHDGGVVKHGTRRGLTRASRAR